MSKAANPDEPDDLYDLYRPPQAPSEAAEPEPERELGILRRWERLRFAYNAILIVEVVLLALGPARSAVVRPGFASMLIFYAVIANLCYCAGPVATAYLHWLGARGPTVVYLLFAMGTLLAFGLAGLVMMFLALGGPFGLD